MVSPYYIFTAFGQDRPGMVAGITGFLYALGANLEDASMTRLGGEFVMMLVVQFPNQVTDSALARQARALEKKFHLQLQIKPIATALSRLRQQKGTQALLSVYGTDKPGIVFHVAEALAKRRINITDLNTRILRRTARPVYVMLLEIQLPKSSSFKTLQKDVKRLQQQLGVDITLHELDAITL